MATQLAEEQSPGEAGTTQAEGIQQAPGEEKKAPGAGAMQPVAAEEPPTVVEAKAIVPAPGEGNVPVPSAIGLQQRQRLALQALAAGAGPGAAARAAGVNPATLFRWRKYDARFIAALNAWRAETMSASQEILSAANEVAARTVLHAVRRGHVWAALAVLKGMGAMAAPKIGGQSTAEVEQQLEQERRVRDLKVGHRLRSVRDRKMEVIGHVRHMPHIQEKLDREAEMKFVEFARTYRKIPPLERPLSAAKMAESVATHSNIVKIYPHRVSIMVVDVWLLDAAELTRILGEENELPVQEAARRLKQLPWLLKTAWPWNLVEQYVDQLESLGAVVELRPSWHDME